MFLRVRCSFYQARFYQREESGMVSIPFEASRLILTDIIFTLRFTRLLTFVFFIIFLLSYLLTFLNIYHGCFLFHIECKNGLRSKLKNRVFDHVFQWRLFKNCSFLLKALAPSFCSDVVHLQCDSFQSMSTCSMFSWNALFLDVVIIIFLSTMPLSSTCWEYVCKTSHLFYYILYCALH